jgi:hypothetical protein
LTEFSKIFILAEDARQQRFVRRYLHGAGFERHVIDPEPLPNGIGGAGEHWVRRHYAAVLMKYRRRATKARTALIVVIDADTEDLSFRSRQLEDSLRQTDAAPRSKGESILHLIPKRNIETWILHLNGEGVDETKDHRHRDVDDLIPIAAAKFHAWSAQVPTHCLPSLLAAIEETNRLT